MAEGEERIPEKVQSPSPVEPGSVHVYPDWSAMQAYYGPRVAIPQYFNPPAPRGHPHQPFAWGPSQPMVPPYGTPYAAVYAHGGVCCHPAVPLATLPAGAANVERIPEKKLKAFDGLSIATTNPNDATEDVGDVKKSSQSVETEYSTDRSEENTAVATVVHLYIVVGLKSKRVLQKRKVSGDGSPLSKKRNATKTVMRSVPVGSSVALASSDACMQDDKELKRERRKQSNRESARRSRLRKRAETEELGRKVDSLTAENVALRSQINKLEEKSAKLRVQNNALVEKLKDGEESSGRRKRTERGIGEEVVLYERAVNSGAELRQLLGPNSRADAVAAR